jgi:hypothetical protein
MNKERRRTVRKWRSKIKRTGKGGRRKRRRCKPECDYEM